MLIAPTCSYLFSLTDHISSSEKHQFLNGLFGNFLSDQSQAHKRSLIKQFNKMGILPAGVLCIYMQQTDIVQ